MSELWPKLFAPYAAPYEDVWGPRRGRIVAAALALVFVVIVGRAAFVSFNGPDRSAVPVAKAEVARRADIVDRKGELLATTITGKSLAVDPSAVWESRDVVAAIRSVFPELGEDALTFRTHLVGSMGGHGGKVQWAAVGFAGPISSCVRATMDAPSTSTSAAVTGSLKRRGPALPGLR